MLKGFKPYYDLDYKQTENQDSIYFIFINGKVVVDECDGKYFFPKTVKPSDKESYIFLGSFQNTYCYLNIDIQNNEDNFTTYHLREMYQVIDDNFFILMGYMYHLYSWLKDNKHCGRCGNKIFLSKNELSLTCNKCKKSVYPSVYPAIIVAIVKDNKILLASSPRFNSKFYSVLAGFVNPGESLEECIRREVKEEVNIDIKNIQYFDSQAWPFSQSLMIGFTAEYVAGELKPDGIEILDANWFEVEKLPSIPGSISIARSLIDWFIETYK